jgi:hypothetical protein
MPIICLANSYKNQGRCIAGIDQLSGEWVRPVSNLDDGRILIDSRLINAERISMLDIVDVPLQLGKGAGHEIENRGYSDLPWQVIGKANPVNLLRYCEHSLLYPDFGKSIPYDFLKLQAPVRTLQLIEVKFLCCYEEYSHKDDRKKWKGVIGDKKYDFVDFKLSITDPIAIEKLNRGKSLSPHCLICMSLGQPISPGNSSTQLCYRLIAGIVELSPELEMILIEMERISWSMEQGREYIQKNFGKISRYQLTEAELKLFLNYLRSLIDGEN